jgi:hypothetical protein
MLAEDQAIADAWLIASADLGIDVTSPFTFVGPLGDQFECIALVHGFGAPSGTLIATANEPFDELFDASRTTGYYVSALNPLHYGKYDRSAFIETLRDWEWVGPVESAPHWYRKVQ